MNAASDAGPGAAASPNDAVPAGDPFLQRFFARVPANVARSFTTEQLDAVRLAFGARDWGEHPVELRRLVGTGRWRYYVVFLMGRARRRSDSHRAEDRRAEHRRWNRR